MTTEQPKENLIRKLTSERYHQIVPMLRKHEDKELHLPMVVLSGNESAKIESSCYSDTLAAFNGKVPKKDEVSNWDAVIDANRAYWTIYYSVRQPDDLKKLWFLDKNMIADEYNWDEAGILMNNYMTVRLNQPHLRNLDTNDSNSFQMVLEMLKKEGTESDFFLNGLTMHSMNQLIKSLAARLLILQKDSGVSSTQ